jgi:hypothetical protein
VHLQNPTQPFVAPEDIPGYLSDLFDFHDYNKNGILERDEALGAVYIFVCVFI